MTPSFLLLNYFVKKETEERSVTESQTLDLITDVIEIPK